MILSTFRRTCWTWTSLLVVLSVSTAQAGPFEDLLFGRRNAYYYPAGNRYVPVAPVVTQYAPSAVTAYQPVAPVTAAAAGCSCNQPVTANYGNVQQVQHTAAYAPAPTTAYFAPTNPTTCYAPAVPTCGCGAPRTVNMYPPVPNYRTVWYRVPVTNFRPVTAMDPATCAQVTTLQPCTTYTWQARRVPASGGLFSWLCRRRGAARVAPIYPYSACVTQPVVSGGTPTIMTTPGMTVQGGQSAADVAPSLDPGNYVPPSNAPLDSGTSIPAESFNGTTETARPTIDCPPTTTLDPYSGNSPAIESGASSSRVQPPRTSSQVNSGIRQPTNERNSAVDTRAEVSAPRSHPLHVRSNEPNPVAAPDAAQRPKRFAPPRLINPRDRRASSGPAPGSFVLVSWPTEAKVQPSRALQTEVAPVQFQQPTSDESQFVTPPQQRTTPAAQPERKRNDSGWRSVSR